MITYRRRNSQEKILKIESSPDTSFLGYCNWSYPKENHINVNEAIKMLNNYENSYMPFYIRIFNEMPRRVLNKFIEAHNITSQSIENIYYTLTINSTRNIRAL